MGKLKFYKKNIISFLFFCVLSLFFTYPLIFKMQTALYGMFFNTDIRGEVWYLWWYKYAFIHRLNYLFCPLVSAPFGLDLSHLPIFWIPLALSRWSSIFLNPILFCNIATILSLILSGFFTYLLVDRLTTNKIASVLAGLIFTFSPYHLNKIMEFSFYFVGNWIILFILTLFALREHLSLKNIIFCSLAYSLVLSFNAYYGFFCLIFSMGLFLFSFFYQRKIFFESVKNAYTYKDVKKEIFSGLRFIGGASVAFIGAVLINSPSLIQMAKDIFFGQSASHKATLGFVRSFDYLIAQSARPLSYLLPASTHPIFGNFTKSMFGSIFYGRGSIEQTLYLGWFPLILAFIAFRQWKHKRLHADQYPQYQSSKENFYIGFFIFSAWLAFFFSMPPVVDLGLFKLYLPSYFTYKILPMFRAYARFGVIVMLCVSVLAGYGIKFILEKIKTKKIKLFFLICIFCSIMFEFTNIPPTHVADLTKLPQVYAWLKQQPGDFIIAEYPMTLSSPGEAWTNYDYLFYQTRHEKKLVNGANIGTDAFKIKEKILRVEDKSTPSILKALGTKYIILHTDLYKEGVSKNVVEVIGEAPSLDKIEGYRFLKAFGSDLVYEVVAKPLSLDAILQNKN
jgi:hypothetical protein